MPDVLRPAGRLIGALLVVLVLASGARADWSVESEHWYVLEIGGGAAGWMRETVFDDGSRYRTSSETRLRVKRGTVEIAMTMEASWVETHDGAPVSLTSITRQGGQSVESTYRFEPDHVIAVTRQSGRTSERRLPRPADGWLTPMAGQRLLLERLEARTREFAFSTITGDQGLEPTELRHVFRGEGELEHGGRTIPVTIWEVTTSAMPIPAETRYSTDGWLVDQVADVPGLGAMRTRLVTREEAMAAGAAPPPELLVATFVEAEPPIEQPRSRRRARYRLSPREGELPELPSAGAQRATREADGRVLLVVDIDENGLATEAERDDPDYLGASPTCDVDDPMVRKLAARAVRGADPDDPAARAEAIRAFVHGYITSKNLDTAFGTASEVARMKRGDCSEHGVLLCALMRAEGIPARVATGLVYADAFAGRREIFGWHMWTQALIDGRWVDYDATLPVRHDAAHVLTGTSSLSETSGMADFASVLLLMGNLRIEVLEVE